MFGNTKFEDFTYLVFDCELMVELNENMYGHSKIKWNGLLKDHQL